MEQRPSYFSYTRQWSHFLGGVVSLKRIGPQQRFVASVIPSDDPDDVISRSDHDASVQWLGTTGRTYVCRVAGCRPSSSLEQRDTSRRRGRAGNRKEQCSDAQPHPRPPRCHRQWGRRDRPRGDRAWQTGDEQRCRAMCGMCSRIFRRCTPPSPLARRRFDDG